MYAKMIYFYTKGINGAWKNFLYSLISFHCIGTHCIWNILFILSFQIDLRKGLLLLSYLEQHYSATISNVHLSWTRWMNNTNLQNYSNNLFPMFKICLLQLLHSQIALYAEEKQLCFLLLYSKSSRLHPIFHLS